MTKIKTTAVKAKPKKNQIAANYLLDIKFQVILEDALIEEISSLRSSHAKLTKADAGRVLQVLVKNWESILMPDFKLKRKKVPKVKAGAELGEIKKVKKVKRFKAGPELAKRKMSGIRTEVQGKKNND